MDTKTSNNMPWKEVKKIMTIQNILRKNGIEVEDEDTLIKIKNNLENEKILSTFN